MLVHLQRLFYSHGKVCVFQVEGGPGSMSPDQSQCDWSSKYAFLDDLQALRESVKGPAATDRLQYWLHSFRYASIMNLQGSCNRQIQFFQLNS